MRLYYFFFDRNTGDGVNHVGVLIDGIELHFSNNSGAETYPEGGYSNLYTADFIKDYPIGVTFLNETELQSVFDGLAMGQFAAGTYRSGHEKVDKENNGQPKGTNNCLSFAHAFVEAIVEQKPSKWPKPLQKAYYGNYNKFIKEMGLNEESKVKGKKH